MSERQKASVSPSVVSFLGSFNSLPWSKPRLQNSVQAPPHVLQDPVPWAIMAWPDWSQGLLSQEAEGRKEPHVLNWDMGILTTTPNAGSYLCLLLLFLEVGRLYHHNVYKWSN